VRLERNEPAIPILLGITGTGQFRLQLQLVRMFDEIPRCFLFAFSHSGLSPSSAACLVQMGTAPCLAAPRRCG
jgi:hypothetical protein